MSEKIPVTVVVPVLNEEANLAKCLERLGAFDEVIVVDSGSSDASRQIALDRGARVINFEWNGQYPKKRNWVLINERLRNEWVLFLDADELITERFCREVVRALRAGTYNGFWLRYTNYFLGRPLKYGDPQRKLALFKARAGLYERIDEEAWSGLDMEVHEHPIIDGCVGEIMAPIEHRDDRGVIKFLKRHQDYAIWEAMRTIKLGESDATNWKMLTRRQKKKYSNIEKWWFAWVYFFVSFILKRGFLDGYAGFAYAFYKLWYFLTIRLIILERRQGAMAVAPSCGAEPVSIP